MNCANDRGFSPLLLPPCRQPLHGRSCSVDERMRTLFAMPRWTRVHGLLRTEHVVERTRSQVKFWMVGF